MELFTRLFDNGIMCFWEKSNETKEYKIKVSIISNDKDYMILQDTIINDKCYYSLSNLGSGEYKIEVQSVSNEGDILDKEVKKINLVSNSQNLNNMSCVLQTVFEKLEDINLNIGDIKELILQEIFNRRGKI